MNNDKAGYAEASRLTLEEQKTNWSLCKAGYESLSNAVYKEFEFNGFVIKVQCNPGRLVSSAAKVDETSVNNRPCFLCTQNLPAEQKIIKFEDDYLILCNPYPIFPEHFTVPYVKHTSQNILSPFDRMLSLSNKLSKYYTVFYNGPKCGASAPDHLHFQAVSKNFMPVENELTKLIELYGKTLVQTPEINISAIDDGLRRYFVIESGDDEKIKKGFNILYKILSENTQGEAEPMFNIISLYNDDNGWQIIIFPRAKHRPSFYFKEGSDRLLVSPATTEMGGLVILPREEDFLKINKELIEEVFKEVVISEEEFKYVCKRLT